jgi:hypothetical protein
VRLGGLAGWWENSRQWVAQRGQRGQHSQRSQRGRHDQRSPQTSARNAKKAGLFGLSRRATTLVVVAVILACTLASGLTPFLLYEQVSAMAKSGLQHIKNAESDLKKVQSNPLDATSIRTARDEFAAAHSDFSGISARLNLVGFAASAPKVGSKISGAQKLMPIAVEATQAGMVACDAMYTLASSLKNPFGTGGGTLTPDRVAAIADQWAQVHELANTIIPQLSQLTPGDLSLDPRIGPAVQQFRAKLPQITQLISDFDGVVSALPMLLGVDKPSTYLMLILDSSELRPTGGFIGNFGTLTINRGQMDPGLKITDITLIDYNTKFWDRIPASYKQVIPIPPQYDWLKQVWADPASATLSLRDSNLDPDYPTAAKAAIDMYDQLQPGAQKTLNYQKSTFKLYDPKANGEFAGVITLSLGFFVEALKATGSVNVSLSSNKGPINETVTSDNFVSLIHKYALGTGSTGSDSRVCGTTSCNKVFTSAVVKAFMDKVKSDPKQYIGKLGKILLASLRTKDVEFFLNDSKAEQTLIDLGIGATALAPKTGDSLFQVDANIGANKDNALLKYKMADQITVDQSGAATHKFTWQYTWPTDPNSLSETFKAVDAGPNYYAYSRIFTPPGATLISQSPNLRNFGMTDASAQTFNRAVFYGNVFVPAILSQTTSFGLSWKAPGVVTHDDAGYHYHLLIQRQAGIIWPLTLTIKLPACAKFVGAPQASGLTSPYANDVAAATPTATATPTDTATATPGTGTPATPNPVTVKGTTVTVTAPLTQDEQIQINYTC